MKAMQIYRQEKVEAHPLRLVEVPTPEIGDEEVLLRVHTCGVCHTDLHEIEGDLPLTQFPRIPGHEVIGRVERRGKKVSLHQVGDRVGVGWLHSTCQNCTFCNRRQENLCDTPQFTGYSVNGGYAEFMKVPQSFAYPIPSCFSNLEAAPLMCAGIIGYRSLKLSNIQPGQTLGLFGFGASAHIVIQIAQAWDCQTYVFTRSENHKQHARDLGATWVGTSKELPPKKLDNAITFAPVGSVVLDALRYLEKGGTVAINAIHLSDIPPISWGHLYYERIIRSVAHTTRQDAREFLAEAEKIGIQTEIHPYALTDANQALEAMKHSEINGAAVLEISP